MLFLCLFQTVIHLPYVNKPAMGTHVWRQCNTLSIARNYHEEDMRIWLPRIDKRYHFPGTTGPSFTAYEYTLAGLYRVFGFSHSLHRWFSLAISILAVAGLFYLARSFLKNNLFATFSAFALIGIPEFYYHSINAVPDLLALAAMVWGWFWARKWIETGSVTFWFGATFMLALAGMVKLQFLVCGLPLATEVVMTWKTQHKRKKWAGAVMVLIVLASAGAWYAYARYLTFQYWLNEFVHDVRLPSGPASFFKLFAGNLISDVPETWVGYGLLPGLVIGAITLFKKAKSHLLAASALLGAGIIYVLLQRQFEQHGYYALFMAPFIAMAAGFGYFRLVSGRYRWLILLLLLAPVWAWIRMAPNWTLSRSRVPESLLRQDVQSEILKLSDTSLRYIVGPDQSGCVYFYYLHAKGFPWYTENDSQQDIAKWVRWGADGIITNRTELLEKHYSDSLIWEKTGEAGGFIWYRVRLRNP